MAVKSNKGKKIKDKVSKSTTSSSSKIKSKSKSSQKAQSKSTKIKIQKLNSDLSEFNEITKLLGNDDKATTNKDVKVLDAKQINEDLQKDQENKLKNKKAENDLNKQLELLTEMGL
ncbi:uncharacterized protein J8A68_001125 [[Candida] subhashii]|uniref:Uncharacterized protein n=1 Tax=[Candida] subhashii TaxID=561895 RepID=A0A8J5QVC2_9ASCO|nr:uncharacterized protein J8A68_001125 [[Candida] subhashii]KAG7665437.1 hypothetical protein J8A68_001125 [[Candida] subhashii]